MNRSFKIGIIGAGRIALAVRHYLATYSSGACVELVAGDSAIKRCDLLVGALAGELGPRCLHYALRHAKNLIDISDVDPPFYLKARRQIEKKKILVVPGCGISPGLVNAIVGRELTRDCAISDIEISAGSLSRRRSYFPYLWCFEDLIYCHQLPSCQVVNGVKRKYAAFDGCRRERFFGIDAESYFCPSGFENVFTKKKFRNFTYRVVRPHGFKTFFDFARNQGFFSARNLPATKSIAEGVKRENTTFAQLLFQGKDGSFRWQIKAHASASEKLNSMQKITAIVPATIASMIMSGAIHGPGLLFMEDIARDSRCFALMLEGIRKEASIVRSGSGRGTA